MPQLVQLTRPVRNDQAKNTPVRTCAHLGFDSGGPDWGEGPIGAGPQPAGKPAVFAPGAASRPSAAAATIRGAYLHIPFCFHKCHYCDFYSIVDNRDRQAAFTARLITEIEACAARFCQPLETIFVGGGTPTLLRPDLWSRLLEVIGAVLPLAPGGEFTVEANPETVSQELMDVLVAGGVNRISIGAQSFNPAHLKTLERWHDPASVERSARIIRGSGIVNINLDLIFAIPGQTLAEWLNDLSAALALAPMHVSCYGLTYEANTPMTAKLRAGGFLAAEQELEAAMYEATIDRLSNDGFEHYEISNWARPGGRCRHNLLYWLNRNWWPLGPSASGHVNGVRWKNVPRLGEYLDHGPLPPITDVEQVDDDTRVGEQLMLRLRLLEGLATNELDALLASGAGGQRRAGVVRKHLADGLLQRAGGSVSLTRRGLLLADTVIADLL